MLYYVFTTYKWFHVHDAHVTVKLRNQKRDDEFSKRIVIVAVCTECEKAYSSNLPQCVCVCVREKERARETNSDEKN